MIAKGCLWENDSAESCNGKLRDDLLNRELFLGLAEVRYVMDRWRIDFDHHRMHSGLNHRTRTWFEADCVLLGFADQTDGSLSGHSSEQSRLFF